MNHEQIVKEIRSDETNSLLNFWEALVKSEEFKKILVMCKATPAYRTLLSDTSIPHTQSERNGGLKAWANMTSLLFSPPNKQSLVITEDSYKEDADLT